MTNPIDISAAIPRASVPDHDDPSDARYWEQWHIERADEIATRPPDSNEAQRVGELMGEVDHRAEAIGYQEMAEKWELGQAKQKSEEQAKAPALEIQDVLLKVTTSGHENGSKHAAVLAQLRALPGVDTDHEAVRLMRAGQFNRALVAAIPESWRQRFGMDSPEKQYQNAVDRGHRQLVDRKADGLLAEREKAFGTLRGVNPNTPPHLLSSEQYRAAEVIIRTELKLQQLRSLGGEEYRAVVHQITPAAKAVEASVQNIKAEEIGQPNGVKNVQQSAQSTSKTKHEIALEEVRRQISSTPTDYQTAAQKAMAERIIAQLQNRAETIALSTRYQGSDLQRAEATHARAVEANMGLIEAIREAGIPLDTGRASISSAKKIEVEPKVQGELDRSMEVLQ